MLANRRNTLTVFDLWRSVQILSTAGAQAIADKSTYCAGCPRSRALSHATDGWLTLSFGEFKQKSAEGGGWPTP
jgi:hypothetical protein